MIFIAWLQKGEVEEEEGEEEAVRFTQSHPMLLSQSVTVRLSYRCSAPTSRAVKFKAPCPDQHDERQQDDEKKEPPQQNDLSQQHSVWIMHEDAEWSSRFFFFY